MVGRCTKNKTEDSLRGKKEGWIKNVIIIFLVLVILLFILNYGFIKVQDSIVTNTIKAIAVEQTMTGQIYNAFIDENNQTQYRRTSITELCGK